MYKKNLSLYACTYLQFKYYVVSAKKEKNVTLSVMKLEVLLQIWACLYHDLGQLYKEAILNNI